MEALVIIAIAACMLLLLGVSRRLRRHAPWHDVFGGLESALAILVIAGAASWYLVARPDSAKLKIEQQVVGYQSGPGSVLVLSEITITNVGARVMKLRGGRYQYYLQKITPLPASVRAEVGIRNPDNTLAVGVGDKWSAIASRSDVFDSDIHSGEAENLYFRVVVPCSCCLRVYSTFWLDRPREVWDDPLAWVRRGNKEADMQWIEQTPLDLTEQCGRKAIEQ